MRVRGKTGGITLACPRARDRAVLAAVDAVSVLFAGSLPWAGSGAVFRPEPFLGVTLSQTGVNGLGFGTR